MFLHDFIMDSQTILFYFNSIKILFYACSHRGDNRLKKKKKKNNNKKNKTKQMIVISPQDYEQSI